MRSSRHDPQNDIDISALPSTIKRSLKPLALATAAVGLLTYGGLLLVPSLYSSEAQIRIGRPGLGESGRAGHDNAEVAAHKLDREAVASRVQELRSPDLARKLARELKLHLRPEFNSAIGTQGLAGGLARMTGLGGPRPGESEEERVLAAYYRALQVYQVKDTRVITLGFTARDGELAARAANRLIELYQEWLRQQGVTETTDANAWLGPEIEKRTRELGDAEAAVERFRANANLHRGATGQASGLAEQQISDMAGELTKAKGQRSEAEARARTARELMARGTPDAIPDVQKSPIIQGLVAQRVRAERDLAEASTQLLPAHPRMKQLMANVADIRRQVQQEARSVVEGLEREVGIHTLRADLASRALEDAKGRLGDKAGDRVQLAQLEDEARAKRQELETLRTRFEASRSRGSTKAVPVEIQVIATALPSSLPSWPNRGQMTALASAATLVLGLVGVLFRGLLAGGSGGGRGRARRVDRREPELATAAKRTYDGSVSSEVAQPTADVAAAAATVATANAVQAAPTGHAGDNTLASVAGVVGRLIGNSAGQGGYRTLIVGAGDGVDVREEATDIAAGLAAAGRQVVLVDWSLSGGGIATALGLAESPGFTELATGAATFDDVIRTLPDGDIHVLPCGAALPGGMARLDPDRLNLMLDALDEAYGDVVVTGTHAAARDLFKAIEGRFDAAIVVGRSQDGTDPQRTSQLLGFDVTEIDVVRLVLPADAGRTARVARRPQQRATLQDAGAA